MHFGVWIVYVFFFFFLFFIFAKSIVNSVCRCIFVGFDGGNQKNTYYIVEVMTIFVEKSESGTIIVWKLKASICAQNAHKFLLWISHHFFKNKKNTHNLYNNKNKWRRKSRVRTENRKKLMAFNFNEQIRTRISKSKVRAQYKLKRCLAKISYSPLFYLHYRI